MNIGHGGLGLRDRIRPFRDLMSDSGGTRRCFVDLRPGKEVKDWSVYSGDVYVTTISASSITYAGIIRTIVAVESLIKPRLLERVETLDEVKPGSWFYDDSLQSVGGSSDLYIQLPDSSDPSGTTVVVQLLFTLSTRGGQVDSGGLLQVSEIHPVLGPERASNARMELWNSTTDLTDWTEENAGATGIQVTREGTLQLEGIYCARIAPGAGGLLPGTAGAIATGPHSGFVGATYMISVAYMTSADFPSDLSARIQVFFDTFVSQYIEVDGITPTTTAGGFTLRPTFGEWRRALFFFVSPFSNDITVSLRLHNSGAGSVSSGYALFDDFHFRRVHRYSLYQPLLSEASIPEVETRSQSLLFGAKTIGLGNLSIIDDGEMSKALSDLLLFRKPAIVYVGGTFGTGEELYRDDWHSVFPAVITRPESSDGEINFDIEDSRTVVRAPLLVNAYRNEDAGILDKRREGLSKPLLFGQTSEFKIPGVGVDVDANGYRYYEFLDPQVPVADGAAVILPTGYSFKVYPNEDLANEDQLGYEVVTPITSSSVANPTTITCPQVHGLTTGDTVVISGHTGSTPSINGTRTVTVVTSTTFTIPVNVTVAGTGGKFVSSADLEITNYNTRWHIKRDVRNYRYDPAGKDIGGRTRFSFGIGGGILFADIDVQGPAWRVAAELQAAMRTAIGGGDTTVTVTYNENTHKFTVARSTGTLQLKTITSTGTNIPAALLPWKILGYDCKIDKTGSTSYTSDVVTFVDGNTEHIIRFTGGGYTDDPSGTIIGTPGDTLDTPPAVASWILQKILGVSPSNIDVASFKFAHGESRSTDFTSLFLYLHTKDKNLDAFVLLGIMEQVGLMDLILDGDGVWHCQKYVSGSTGAREFFDRDYLSWKMWLDPSALFKDVKIQGAYNPCKERFMSYSQAAVGDLGSMPVKAGAENVFDLEGYLSRESIESGLGLIQTYYGRLIGKMPRVVEFSAAGKLVDLVIGNKIKLTRSKAFDPTGQLDAVTFRIIGMRHNYISGISACQAVEDVTILT